MSALVLRYLVAGAALDIFRFVPFVASALPSARMRSAAVEARTERSAVPTSWRDHRTIALMSYFERLGVRLDSGGIHSRPGEVRAIARRVACEKRNPRDRSSVVVVARCDWRSGSRSFKTSDAQSATARHAS